MTPTRLAALLLVATACGGGGGPVATNSPAPTAPTTPGTEAPSEVPSATAKHGSAVVTYQGVAAAWPERGCETTRGRTGEVVGWLATFQDADDQARNFRVGVTESRHYVQIRVRRYTGAGKYPSEQVSVRYVGAEGPAVASGFGLPGQSLTLTDGGHRGEYKSKSMTVRIECDPADDTSTDPGQALSETPAPGTAYVVRPEGAVLRFEGVRCGKAGADTQVTAGRYPHFFRVSTRTKPGASGGGRVLLGVHGVVIPFDDPNTRIALTGSPVRSGTFRYSPSGASSDTDVTEGAFACG
ncbi:MAG TPA: hypothetical protein VNA20_15180 [Frankiaceae bacterium]|nr:hypothetical protein [Frankiaceae bacterium]